MISKASTIRAALRLHHGKFSLNAQFDMPARGISALFGRSASGKTTLLRCLAGLEPKACGRFYIGDICLQDRDTFIPAHQRRIGYVFQEPSLFIHHTVRGNLDYARARAPLGALQFDQVVEMLSLAPLLERPTDSLSGGQQQRVSIARALLSQPRLLLLDEPLSGLDLDSRHDILPYLERLHRELALPMLYVSHSPAEVQRLADYLLLIEAGRITASGEIQSMLTRTDLPLSHLEDSGAVLHARVEAHDNEFHLTRFSAGGGTLTVSRQALSIGESTRLRVLARDVSVALSAHPNSSINNQLDARIEAIEPDRDPAQALLQLRVGEAVILARITRKSVQRLQLHTGQKVLAQIKSVALL